MSKIIALFNQAGGVAKTTLTMNLGYHLAQLKSAQKKQNYRVLLIDIDPQATLTNFMGLEPNELEQTIYDAIIEQKELPIHSNLHGLDLVPASVDLSSAELELVVADMRDLRLKYALETVQDEYDLILIDCPPSLGILSYIALVASIGDKLRISFICQAFFMNFSKPFNLLLLLMFVAFALQPHQSANIQL